jgi:cation transport protein ChaC
MWVFGYGSLMWRPGFAFAERRPARLAGHHRALCVYSHVHRGTPERPGLVLGLDRGGSCRGVAFRVAPGEEASTLAYLRERELVTNVYVEAERRVRLLDGGGDEVTATCYLVDRAHGQYAGKLPRERQLAMVRGSRGRSGANPDYVIATHEHLLGLGIVDPVLAWLAAELVRDHDSSTG